MRELLKRARTRVGVAVISSALLAVGGTATAAVITSSPATDEVSDESPVVTEPTVTAIPEPPVVDQAPVAPQVVDTPAASVEDVTEPEPEAVAPVEPTPANPEPPATVQEYDIEAPWVDPSGVTFIPAPERTPEPPQVLD